MRKLAAVTAVGALVVAMSSCGSGGSDQSPLPETSGAIASTPASASSKSSVSPTSSPSPSTSTSSEEAQELTGEPAAGPSFVRCHLADGTALMSDGSTTYVDSCNESAGGPLLLEDGTSIYDRVPQVDLDKVPIADGGNCPAAICGYGHDENGNPNPSSGEIQTKHGCDEGYITDPSLCAAVNEKYDW